MKEKRGPCYEYFFPGGVSWEGDEIDGDHADFSIVEGGTGEPGNPFTLMLTVTTGMASFNLCSMVAKDVARLGKWLQEIAEIDNAQRADRLIVKTPK